MARSCQHYTHFSRPTSLLRRRRPPCLPCHPCRRRPSCRPSCRPRPRRPSCRPRPRRASCRPRPHRPSCLLRLRQHRTLSRATTTTSPRCGTRLKSALVRQRAARVLARSRRRHPRQERRPRGRCLVRGRLSEEDGFVDEDEGPRRPQIPKVGVVPRWSSRPGT